MDLPPVPYQNPVSDRSGTVSPAWAAWFRQLFASVTTLGTAASVTYPLSISNGGTGQSSRQSAINALTGTQSSGKYLRSDGVNAALATIQAADVPTLNQNTTGTASNITASSNSTLTTLSALSLPGSQVTGNISGNAANVTGTVAIANGGTGQTTQQAAMNALAGTQSSGKYLRSDGVNTTLTTIQAGDVPTLNQNTTGTASNVTGTVAIANGGTGQTTQQAAINALTGTQSSGKYLRSDGVNASLSTIQAADVPTLNQNTTGTASNVTGTVAIANGGTGQTAKAAAFDALSPTTTKGDLIVSTGSTNVRQAVGSNGQILYADSTQTNGIKWAALGTLTVVSKTTTYTASNSDDVILCSASGGAWTLSLPAAASNTGKLFRIKKTDSSSNAVTIDPNASETLDGALTVDLKFQYESLAIVCDGTGWYNV